MKYLILLSVLLATPVFAKELGFEWDINPAAEGYAVFSRDAGIGYDDPIWEGSLPPAFATVPDDMVSAFVCRAWRSYIDLDGVLQTEWSGDSNELIYIPEAPDPPKNFRRKIIQALKKLFKKSKS